MKSASVANSPMQMNHMNNPNAYPPSLDDSFHRPPNYDDLQFVRPNINDEPLNQQSLDSTTQQHRMQQPESFILRQTPAPQLPEALNNNINNKNNGVEENAF